MEGPKAGSTAQSQISNHHRAARDIHDNSTNQGEGNRDAPVEGPFEQELAGSLGKVGIPFMWLQALINDTLQPFRPLFQRVLLLQGLLEIHFNLLHYRVITLAHPRCLFL
jgi:hypothetical protein